jgi:single-strand DNA-binding protein
MNVLVEGRLSIRSYETKEGEKRKATEIVANDMQMLDSKRDNPGGAPTAGGGYASTERGSSRPAGTGDDDSFDEEIPF